MEGFLIALAAAVVSGLILYFVFGIGKADSHPTKKVSIKKSPNTVVGDHNIAGNVVTNVYNQPFNKEDSASSIPKQSTMTPLKIMNEIKSRPLYQQDEAGSNYIGNKVTWEIQLASIRKYNDILQVIGVQTDKDTTTVAVVSCEVKEKEYPRLQTLNQYDNFYITGTISKVNGTGIDIEDSTLSFMD
jgi:hypothetical protein